MSVSAVCQVCLFRCFAHSITSTRLSGSGSASGSASGSVSVFGFGSVSVSGFGFGLVGLCLGMPVRLRLGRWLCVYWCSVCRVCRHV